ncbi:hypothetical protein CGMCC3_g17808 [Colletotrichum fructicola]|nr:uncharacterized protein CGMCC3_g17808 [Colletotrichum fructicola]KAE9566012.1 hypothetical protein CGMCC3_g17808 [Colletotrichum fructicola]
MNGFLAFHQNLLSALHPMPASFLRKPNFTPFGFFARPQTFRFVNCLSNPDDYVLSSDGESVRDSIARENLHDFSDTLPSPKYSLLASTDPI